MRKFLPVGLGASMFLLMIAAPFYYKQWQDHEYRNFHVVEEGVLYRSGQLPLPRLQQICMNHRIRTIVCLREGDKQDDQAEESWVKARGLNFVRIPPRTWWPDSAGNTPADESVAEFRKVMDDPANYPVLVHCYAGIHRTGTMCAVFRMDYQGWTNDEAMNEMRTYGYTMLDDHEDILGYLTRYHPQRDAKTIPAKPAGASLPLMPGQRLGEARSPKKAETPKRKQEAISLDEVVVNLREEELNRFLRAKITVAVEENDVKDVTELLTKRKAFLKGWLIGYLSDQSISDVTRKSGIDRLRREICEQFNAMLFPNGEKLIADILFDEFVVQ